MIVLAVAGTDVHISLESKLKISGIGQRLGKRFSNAIGGHDIKTDPRADDNAGLFGAYVGAFRVGMLEDEHLTGDIKVVNFGE